MITIVYVLISNEKDLYYEQALLSLYSLRLHNPDANVVILVDEMTNATFVGKRALIRTYASEIKVIDVPEQYSPKERSRFIKTTFRRYIPGTLLFIDTDTIITGTLNDVENIDAEMACVLDYHAPLDRLVDGTSIRQNIKNIFGENISDEPKYYNSGVILVKDVPIVHKLFDDWFDYWRISAFERKQCLDQPALLMADRKNGHIIQEMDGSYNCQVLASIQFLYNARIIHYFNNIWAGKSEFSPFFRDELYFEIKKTGKISDEIHQLVVNCKSAFYSPSYYISYDKVRFMGSLVGATCYSLYKKNNLVYKILNYLCKMRSWLHARSL